MTHQSKTRPWKRGSGAVMGLALLCVAGDSPDSLAAQAAARSPATDAVRQVVAKGPKMTVRLNGQLVAEGSDTEHARGPIALQYAAGTVRFRNVQIR